MAVRQLVLIAAILLFHYSEVAKTGRAGRQPSLPLLQCNVQEQSYLFNNCLMAFGAAHLKDKAAMMRATTCLTTKLQCRAAGTAVECINKLPASAQISNNCTHGMKDTLSYMLIKFGFGCTYEDIETKCWGKIANLTTSSPPSRTQYGNNSPRRPFRRHPARWSV